MTPYSVPAQRAKTPVLRCDLALISSMIFIFNGKGLQTVSTELIFSIRLSQWTRSLTDRCYLKFSNEHSMWLNNAHFISDAVVPSRGPEVGRSSSLSWEEKFHPWWLIRTISSQWDQGLDWKPRYKFVCLWALALIPQMKLETSWVLLRVLEHTALRPI